MAFRQWTLFVFALAATVAATGASASASSTESGIASTYSEGPTATGERVLAAGLTAAHRTLPFGTFVRVTNTHNGRSVVVRINDRGPFVTGRIIDLAPMAAHVIGIDDGLGPVDVTVLQNTAK